MRFQALRFILPILMALAFPATSSASVKHDTNIPSIHATLVSAPVPAPNTAPLALTNLLALAAIVGATKKMDLPRTYLFAGDTYGPGVGIDVPDDFPELDDAGDVIHEPGSAAERNAARARSFSSAPNTGGVNTGEVPATTATQPGAGEPLTEAQLKRMKVSELQTLAAERGVTVTREDEEEGDPTKADYVRALAPPESSEDE